MKTRLFRIATLLFLAFGVAALNAQTPQTSPQDTQHPTAAQQPQQNDMQPQAAGPFSGTIVKEKGKLVLKDSTTNMNYQLDDQEKAKQFEGKQVKVTGKLDGKVIHVENIEAAGA